MNAIKNLSIEDINKLQKYFLLEYNVSDDKYQEGKYEYIRYDDLIDLLK